MSNSFPRRFLGFFFAKIAIFPAKHPAQTDESTIVSVGRPFRGGRGLGEGGKRASL